MELPFFYEPLLAETDRLWQLSPETHKHALQVLRMKANDAMHVTNGKGLLCRAIITQADKKASFIQVQSVQFIEPAATQLAIGISALKNANRLEWFLEKATEIGMHQIHLLQCQRTEKQHIRFDRLQGVLVAAMLQSQQTWLPILHEPQPLETQLQSAAYNIKLIAHCNEGEKMPLQKLKATSSCLLLIGPEGDFTPQEVALATDNGFMAVSLGQTRLRTETAGVVGAALLANA
jgi:16S rRNA (uracil1498-N3)-methyltransferase